MRRTKVFIFCIIFISQFLPVETFAESFQEITLHLDISKSDSNSRRDEEAFMRYVQTVIEKEDREFFSEQPIVIDNKIVDGLPVTYSVAYVEKNTYSVSIF